MKRIIIIAIFLILNTFVHSQNLVPNSSFELYINCPYVPGNFDLLNWSVTANSGYSSPDYYNVCSVGYMTVPSNLSGIQNPYHGDGYIGLFCYGYNSTEHEYTQVQLNQPLLAGKAYRVSFFVSLADVYGIAVNSLGGFLSINPVSGNGLIGVIDSLPQIISNTLLSDYTNWMEISDIYCANGGEEYLTIGNFSYDSLSSPTIVDSSAQSLSRSYYYIDSVSVILIDNYLDVSVAQTSSSLIANNSNANYQWLDCNNDTLLIPGESNQIFTPEINGYYAVEITENACVDTSTCMLINSVGLIESRYGDNFNVYPNPTSSQLIIAGNHLMINEIKIIDITGKVVKSITIDLESVDVSDLPYGIYFIKIITEDGTISKKFEKH